MAIGVFVRWFDGKVFYVNLCDREEQLESTTVLQLKQKIIEIKKDPEVTEDRLELIFRGRTLVDSALLPDYGVVNMSVVNASANLRGGGELESGKGDDSMGDKDKNRSMEKLALF